MDRRFRRPFEDQIGKEISPRAGEFVINVDDLLDQPPSRSGDLNRCQTRLQPFHIVAQLRTTGREKAGRLPSLHIQPDQSVTSAEYRKGRRRAPLPPARERPVYNPAVDSLAEHARRVTL